MQELYIDMLSIGRGGGAGVRAGVPGVAAG